MPADKRRRIYDNFSPINIGNATARSPGPASRFGNQSTARRTTRIQQYLIKRGTWMVQRSQTAFKLGGARCNKACMSLNHAESDISILNRMAGVMTPGAALKSLRARRGWTLAEVSERTGVPISTLSKVENEKADLTMDRLLRISAALEVNIADLFRSPAPGKTDPPARTRRSISRAGEGGEIASSYGHYAYLAQDLLDKQVMPIIAEIRARTVAEFGAYHRHVGEEFIHVLEGELALYTDTYAPALLSKGDSIYFDATMEHAYISVGEGPCRLLLICAPGEPLRFLEDRQNQTYDAT
jgi:transcriptional regulator with XRE-family HTH domain